MAKLALGNLAWTNGKVNPSGIKPVAYRIPREDIATWPTIVDDPTAVGVTIDTFANFTGDFVLVATKVWETVYSTQGKGKVTFEPVGETDASMFLNKGTLSFPDLTDEVRAFAKMSANGDYVYIIPTPNGRYHVIGNADYRVKTTLSGDSGDAPGSAKGVTINVECPDVTPLPLYQGDLVTAAGSLDTETGTFTPTT